MTKYIVRGQRVLLTPPEIKKSAIEVNAALEKEILEEQMKKWNQLEVFAIGEEVEGIEVGDRVSVNLMFLRNSGIILSGIILPEFFHKTHSTC